MRGWRSPAFNLGGDRRHSPEGTRDARANHIGRHQRAQQSEDAGQDERARNAALGMRNHSQGLARGDEDVHPAGQDHAALEQSQVAHIGEVQRGVAVMDFTQLGRKPVLGGLLSRRLAVVRARVRKQLGPVGARWRSGHLHEQQGRAGAEGLRADIACRPLGHPRGRGLVGGACRPLGHLRRFGLLGGDQGVREVTRVTVDLLVDLMSQLAAGATVDNHEGDSRGDEHDERHPGAQAPAQAAGNDSSSRHHRADRPDGRKALLSFPRRAGSPLGAR